MHTLYLCYFGLREPLVQTQVLPYLRELRRDGIEVSLLTFEPEHKKSWTDADERQRREQLKSEGIEWHSLPYHKRPSALVTPYDIMRGAWFAASLARRRQVDVLHARGHIPGVMGALAKRLSNTKLVFDIRGFLPEEYTDAGVWPEGGLLFRTMKKVETYVFAKSDAFIVLTKRAREILFENGREPELRPVEVIPCCVDDERFASISGVSRENARKKLGLGERRVFVYVGSFGGWYMTDEMTRFLAQAHRRDKGSFAMILTQSDPHSVTQRLLALGLAEKDFLVTKVDPKEIPLYLRAANVAISFIRPCYSKLSSSPTKIAEYLASGLPVVCNSGVGDLDELIETDRVGVLLSTFDEESYDVALDQLDILMQDPTLEERCRASARKRFSLHDVGGQRYRRLYRRLFDNDSAAMEITPA